MVMFVVHCFHLMTSSCLHAAEYSWREIESRDWYSLTYINLVAICTCKNNRQIWRHNSNVLLLRAVTDQFSSDVTMLGLKRPSLTTVVIWVRSGWRLSTRVCVFRAWTHGVKTPWRHQIEDFSELLALCAGNSPVTGKFPSQRASYAEFWCLIDVGQSKWLNKPSIWWWFETLWRQLWRQIVMTLQWRHNGRDGVSNHQHHDCLLNRLFRRRSKKTSKLLVTGLYAGKSPGTGEFPAQMASNADDVIMNEIIYGLSCITSFWPIVKRFTNDFNSWLCHSWKWLANHLICDQKALFTVNHVLFYVSVSIIKYNVWRNGAHCLRCTMNLCAEKCGTCIADNQPGNWNVY